MGLIIQTFGHNSARQRDKIPTLLEELAIAQEEVKCAFYVKLIVEDLAKKCGNYGVL